MDFEDILQISILKIFCELPYVLEIIHLDLKFCAKFPFG